MYATRSLSQLLKSPESLAAPPEGPNSGYLVIQDEESETYSCFGLCKNRTLKELPFPQNKELTVRYTTNSGEHQHVSLNPVLLIPLLNHPLSSNRYYAIAPHGKHKGKAYTCSTEEGKTTCCFCRCIKDVKPRPLEPQNIYQQFKIVPREELCSSGGSFFATSIAEDGFPPYFLRRKGWNIYTKTPDYFKLEPAEGVDYKLRARLPEFNLPISRKSSEPIVVGRWYSPFMFVEEGLTVRDQVKRSTYYEVTLEQIWELIFHKKNSGSEGNAVEVDSFVEREEVFVGGSKANEKSVSDGVVWFTSYSTGGEKRSAGLRAEIVERMKWEEERGGWVNGGEVKLSRVEEFKEGGKWSEFGCYVLVESFNVKRMDGSLVLSYDFKHLHQIKTKWA